MCFSEGPNEASEWRTWCGGGALQGSQLGIRTDGWLDASSVPTILAIFSTITFCRPLDTSVRSHPSRVGRCSIAAQLGFWQNDGRIAPRRPERPLGSVRGIDSQHWALLATDISCRRRADPSNDIYLGSSRPSYTTARLFPDNPVSHPERHTGAKPDQSSAKRHIGCRMDIQPTGNLSFALQHQAPLLSQVITNRQGWQREYGIQLGHV